MSENRIAGIEVKNAANPIVLKNNICNGRTGGVYIHDGVRKYIGNKNADKFHVGSWPVFGQPYLWEPVRRSVDHFRQQSNLEGK